ncbi:MAG: 30S ribosomal protein S1 [Rubricoccaceae bacterium]
MADTPQTPQTPEEGNAPTITEPTITERLAETASGVADAVSDAVSSAAETVAEVASAVAETVAETVTDVASVAAERAEALVARENRAQDAPASTGDASDEAPARPLGYTGEGLGRTVTLEELERQDRRRGPSSGDGAPSDDDLAALYEGSMNAVAEGEVVTGHVVAITDKDVVVDIGFKSDGLVAKNEFPEPPQIGDEVRVFVSRLEDRRGQLMLSKTEAVNYERWEIIENALENGTILQGEIVKRIKGGMIVNLLGAEAFLPGSQVDVRPVRDFDVYLGKTMEFKVVKTNPANGNVVISHKALIEKDLQHQRQQILDSLEVGQVLEGVVKNIVNFGVFVDLGGVDGLLHITDLSWGRVGHPSEVVELDQKLNVVVLDYDRERQRISLGYKQLQKHPWDLVAENYAEGMEVEGRVVSITDYGAFVELEKGIEGLVHISEMSWTEHVKHPTQKVQLGQAVRVKILKIDNDEKKISLGMKQLEPDPWEDLIARFPVGTITSGKVRNITTFGAFVELEPGIDGLVHVSDLSWTKRVKHPSEVVRKGQDLDVIVLDIDVANRRISLGHKQVSTDPWNQFATAYPEGTDTTGRVTDITDGGLEVELPLEAEAFVPASHLARNGRPSDVYAVGDELELRVIRLDAEDRQIVCSETAKQRAQERLAREGERAEKTRQRQEERREVERFARQSTGPATLGELSGLAALRDQLATQEAARAGQPNAGAGQEPPVTSGKASSALEDTVGTGPRVVEQPEDTAPRGDKEAATAMRPEEGGDLPGAEQAKATLKGAALPEEGSLASRVDAAVDEKPQSDAEAAAAVSEDAQNISPADVAVPDELRVPKSEIGAPASDSGAEQTELGDASATIEGDLDAAAGDDKAK